MSAGLHLEPGMGLAGDMFCASLIGLGAPDDRVIAAMKTAASTLGHAEIEALRPAGDRQHVRMNISLSTAEKHLPADTARRWLEEIIEQVSLRSPYAQFARRALGILTKAEQRAHHHGSFLSQQASSITMQPIGVVHSPYTTSAPAQPSAASHPEPCRIEVAPELAPALAELARFRHIWILSYLHRAEGFDLFVKPPWDREHHESYGLFATRSPRRPNPIALTKARLLSVQDNVLFTSSVDLYDGTPVLDIKPYVKPVDEFDEPEEGDATTGSASDTGWVDPSSAHLDLHRRNIPHDHGGEPTLHEAMDILLDVTGAATALQELDVDLERVTCAAPVYVGGGDVRFSHGMLQVPTPATRNVLEAHAIPFAAGPVDMELLTPTGAAILAALRPTFLESPLDPSAVKATGWGLGTRETSQPNELAAMLTSR